MKPIAEFLTPTQSELFDMLRDMYRNRTTIYTCKGSYILVKGEAPVMLIAHLDTVHREPVKEIYRDKSGNILMSPQGIGGDDRCGVYALNVIYEKSLVKPWLLFTCDEEIGGKGAEMFCLKHSEGKLPKELEDLKMLIEIDRKGSNDAVYYDCENTEFENYITSKGFNTQFGSFSDISYIAPELGVAAVNLSSGYYNTHTLYEYIDLEQLNGTIRRVLEIIADAVKPDFSKYEYICNWDSLSRCDLASMVPKDIPEELRKQYLKLLDYYSIEELESYRFYYGDWIISDLYENEFGYYEEDEKIQL